MDNMELYNKAKSVPKEAKKPIGAGRLKGFTDVNPMWRIKRLTEMFGACGIGWWYEITGNWLETAPNGEIKAFVNINLFYEYEGKVSHAIPGTGGSSFLSKERSGDYVSDECYKMALTDAISVAAKSIGVAADVYYEKDRDKYTATEEETASQPAEEPKQLPKYVCSNCNGEITGVKSGGKIVTAEEIAARTQTTYGKMLCTKCAKAASNASHEG